jgi:hypothetical protein
VEKENSSAGADLVIPALALAFVAYFFVSTAELAWEAKANAVVIGTVLLILTIMQVVRIVFRVARRQAGLGMAVLWEPRDVVWKRVGMVAVTAVFIAALPWLGLTLSLWLGMLAALWIMGLRRPRILVLLPLATAGFCYALFIAVLDAGFPRGPLEALLGSLLRLGGA